MERTRGIVSNFREHVHQRGQAGAVVGYESVFDVAGTRVRLLLREPAPVADGDEVEVEGQVRGSYLVASRYTNHSNGTSGTARRWASQEQLWVIAIIAILVLLFVVVPLLNRYVAQN